MIKNLFLASLFLYNICSAREPSTTTVEQNETQNKISSAVYFDFVLELDSANDGWLALINEAKNLAQIAPNLSMNDCIGETFKLIHAVKHETATQNDSDIHGSLSMSLSTHNSLEDINSFEDIAAPHHIAIRLMVSRNNENDLALWENIETIVAELQNSLSSTEEGAEGNAIEAICNAVSELTALISENDGDSISPYLYISAGKEEANNIVSENVTELVEDTTTTIAE